MPQSLISSICYFFQLLEKTPNMRYISMATIQLIGGLHLSSMSTYWPLPHMHVFLFLICAWIYVSLERHACMHATKAKQYINRRYVQNVKTHPCQILLHQNQRYIQNIYPRAQNSLTTRNGAQICGRKDRGREGVWGKVFPKTLNPPQEMSLDGVDELVEMVKAAKEWLHEILEAHAAIFFKGFGLKSEEELLGAGSAADSEAFDGRESLHCQCYSCFSAYQLPS